MIAAAAYIAGKKMYDERQQMTHNYERKRGVEHIEMLSFHAICKCRYSTATLSTH